ncbi:GntR family transcriptional regulator [Paenibacillus sp. J5C_2022]|uniref:GntR family transcriptional regulator n=1 Tax=Paenibacillus sp. J5C2022 TaxID=2977129 RepID=UPI0021D07F77|nr:GntR family transcriptional regulator [Paenibacillus sp. J5C2022]MCU6712535.1 GntR family transcriptional regulator [Paenibacillus sp. J5C2022]
MTRYDSHTSSRSTRDNVYQALKEQIVNLKLAPGTPLSENETSVSFQVSRTPVRESFMKLAQEGLVQVLPQRGTFVSLIDTALVAEARFMREQLECAVIKLACEAITPDALQRLETNLLLQQDCVRREDEDGMFRLDQEFHRLLFESCGKSNTWNAMSQLTVHLSRSRKLMLTDDHDWRHLYNQHREMIDCIKLHDADKAASIMKSHISLNIVDQALLREKYPHYFTNESD